MVSRRALATGMAMLLLVAGCGRTQEKPSTRTATAAQSAQQPLQGKAPRHRSQFIGTWFSTPPSPLLGMEFLKENKVLLSPNMQTLMNGPEVAMRSYDILDGGRLSLTALDGQTEIFNVIMTPDQLQLTSGNGHAQRYRRLAASETLQTALEGYLQAQREAYKNQVDALSRFITAPGLLLTIHRENGQQDLTLALAPQSNGGSIRQGQAWYDTNPPATVMASFNLQVNQGTPISRIQIGLGNPLGNQASPGFPVPDAIAGQFNLVVDGTPGNLRIKGELRINNQPATAALSHDVARHRAIIKKFNDHTASMEAVKVPITQALNDFVILRGTSTSYEATQPQPTQDQIILVRDATNPASRWHGEIQVVNPNGSPTRLIPFNGASVVVLDQVAYLLVPGVGREYQLPLDNGQFKGIWRPNASHVGYACEMQIIQATDQTTHDADIQSQRQKLMAITPSQDFQGFVPAFGSGREKTPVVLNLTLQPDGQIVAKAYYTLFRSLVTMKGQIVNSLTGPAIQLQFVDIPAGQQDVRISANMLSLQLRNQRWNLQLADTGPITTFTGYLSNAGQGIFSFIQRSDTWKAKQDTLLKNLLSDGQTFAVTFPRRNDVEPTLIKIKLDDVASGKVTGVIASGGRHLALQPLCSITGQITDQGPWAGVKLQIAPPPGGQGSQYAMELVVLEKNGQAILNGVFYATHAPQAETYVQLEPVKE